MENRINWKKIIKKYTPSKYKGNKKRFRLMTDAERDGLWDQIVYSAKLLNCHYNGQSQLLIIIYKQGCLHPDGNVQKGRMEDVITVYLDNLDDIEKY